MVTNQIEEIITSTVVDKVNSDKNTTDDQIEQMIAEEIKSANYINEDWQIHYAKDRIMAAVLTATNRIKPKTPLGRVIFNVFTASLAAGLFNAIVFDKTTIPLLFFFIFYFPISKIKFSKEK